MASPCPAFVRGDDALGSRDDGRVDGRGRREAAHQDPDGVLPGPVRDNGDTGSGRDLVGVSRLSIGGAFLLRSLWCESCGTLTVNRQTQDVCACVCVH